MSPGKPVRAILARDDLELVGAFAHSPSKDGRDIAELCNLPNPTGIKATRDVAALLALADWAFIRRCTSTSKKWRASSGPE